MVDLIDMTKEDIVKIAIKRLISDDIIKELFEEVANDLCVQAKAGKLESYTTITDLFSNPYYKDKMKNYSLEEYKQKFILLLNLKGFEITETDKVSFK